MLAQLLCAFRVSSDCYSALYIHVFLNLSKPIAMSMEPLEEHHMTALLWDEVV